MKKKLLLIPLVLIGIMLLVIAITLSSAMSVEPIIACEPIGDAHPLCGWQNPEDMEALPDERFVLVSEIGDQNGTIPGMISLLDLETETRTELYSGGTTVASGEWGELTCTEVANGVFSPHGIHLSERADGTLQLLVVQHGSRESIEMFEVIETDDTWELAWRGCAIVPDGSMINDVVATPDDGFLVTHMMTKSDNEMATFGEYIKGNVLGSDTGYVISWNPTDGFAQLANSSGIVPNGIQISDDGEIVFVNYSNGELRRINRLTGEIEARNDTLPPLDNATWAPNGRLILAGGSQNPVDMVAMMMNCTNLEAGTCPASHVILSVDPDTLASEVIYEGGPDTPGGAGTVGLEVSDGSLLIGTFAGDRIVRVNAD
jgi:hypothetical protein